jgi:hypothetical protein
VLIGALAVLAGAAVALAAGRRTPVPWPRLWPALPAAGVAAVATYAVPGRAGAAIEGAGLAGLALWAASSWRRPGMVLVAAGLAANAAVLLANGGMPVKGMAAAASAPSHHLGLSASDRLTGLSDVIALNPVHQMVSAGDLMAAAGGGIAAFAALAPPPRRKPAPG